MRQCSRCRQKKPDQDFAWRRKAKGQRDSYCRPCRAEYKQWHYALNKQRYVANAAAWNRATLAERTAFMFDFLEAHPCVDCGERDPIVLEFDHLGDKSFEIGSGFRNRKWEIVLEEMAKCDVVCVNCHRRRTARRAGSQRFRSAVQHQSSHGTSSR